MVKTTLIKSLQLMFVYTNINRDLFVIPYDRDFRCKVFEYNKVTMEVKDYGYLWYKKDGKCLGVPQKNVTLLIATNNLDYPIKEAIKNWKKQFKKEQKDAQ